MSDFIEQYQAWITWDYSRSSGPGGQNVNKVETKARLYFDIQSSGMEDKVQKRLRALAGKRILDDGRLMIEAQTFRSKERNKREALTRLFDLIYRAHRPPRPRHATKPTAASKRKRLESKKRKSITKQNRSKNFERD